MYGPREKDYFVMAKSIKQHSDFAVGYKRQDITFVYVTDVVQAVFLAMEKGEDGRVWVLRIITFFGEYSSRLTGKVSVLNNDKFNILKQRNWRCDIQPAIDELGYQPQVKLEEGVKRSIKWYKENGWL